VYAFGDFNLDALQYSSNQNVKEYIDMLFSYGLLQIVVKPTRVTNNSATLIDHLLTNSKNKKLETVILISKLSDHFPIIYIEQNSPKDNADEFFEARNFSNQNINCFQEILAQTDWNSVLSADGTQDAYNNFASIFFGLYDIHFPTQRIKFNKNCHRLEKWMSAGILTSRREKMRLCKLSLMDPTPANLSCFKRFRNLYNRVIRAAKKQYFETELKNNQSNLKKSWQLLKTAINKNYNKGSHISKLVSNGTVVEDPREMATLFNDFFTSMPGKIVVTCSGP
jgi:hypothetical protein